MRRGLPLARGRGNSPGMGRWNQATTRRSRRGVESLKEREPPQAPPSGNTYRHRPRPETTQLPGSSVQIRERVQPETPDNRAFGGRSKSVGRLATRHNYDGPPNCERVEDIIRYRLRGLGISRQTATVRQAPSASPGTHECKER